VRAGLPDDVHHVEKWRLALEMIDELIGWGVQPPVILADGAYGDNTEFRRELAQREFGYVLDVKSTTSAYSEGVKPERPEYQGRGQPPKSRYRQAPSSLAELALAAGETQAVTVCWREGTRGEMTSRFLTLRVRPANIALRRAAHDNGEELPLQWLICEWPEHKPEPVKYWLSNLPADTSIEDLVRLGSCAGGSSMTTTSSRTRSGSITSRVAPTEGSTTTSRWYRSHTRFSPSSADATVLDSGRQPDPLPGRPGAPNAPGLLARNLPRLPQRATARTPTTRTANLTEHY
jgi:hypothetical protein